MVQFLFGELDHQYVRGKIMSCTATSLPGDELAFVLSLHTRTKEEGQCRGPLLRLAFLPCRVFVMETIFASPSAEALLWGGLEPDGQVGIHFTLCGAHWLDLAALIWMRARQLGRSDFRAEADQLLHDACVAAGWDAKEIVNMFQWQQARLT